jgi:selenocysteine lyase/cysteine desulfurase
MSCSTSHLASHLAAPSASRPVLRALALCALLGASVATQAADAVTDALQQAYAPYRAVLFKTNMGTQAEAQQAMDQARAAWAAIGQRYGAQVPAPYDRDTGFAATLAAVNTIYADAAAQIAKQQLPQAHDTLEAVREQLAALRHRNGVVVFSDAMNAYHAQMEVVMLDGPKMLAGPKGVIVLAGAVGALDHLARGLAPQASADVANNPEFQAMLRVVRGSVDTLQDAVRSQDPAAIRQAIGQLKGPYSKLFAKFG